MEKTQAVRLLLLSMHDYLPTVKGSTGLLASVPGAGESLYLPCPDCAETGRIVGEGRFAQPCEVCKAHRPKRPNHGCTVCRVCWGRGQKKGRASDPYDAYTGKPLAELGQETATARGADRKRRVILETQPDAAQEEGWLRTAEQYERAGSYAELRRALEWLRDRFPFRYEMVSHWVSAQDDPWWSWSERALARIDESIGLLAATMPDKIRVPSWVVRRTNVRSM